MANWFRRTPRRAEIPRLRSRSEGVTTTKVDLVEFTPPLLEYLGRAAYMQLTIFENLSRAITSSPTTEAKTVIARVAEVSISRHRALCDEIARAGGVASEVMEPYTKPIDDFDRVTRGADWYEILVTSYLTSGFLDDFYSRLAAGLPEDSAKRVQKLFATGSGEGPLGELLRAAIEESPRLASRLAMWGRRLVGDTMLVARSALAGLPARALTRPSDEDRIEPVFTELIAAHTRRMDALGLTA